MKKIVTLLLVLLLDFSTVAILTVKGEARTIVVPTDYSTIQEAVDHASAGDTVFVKKGTYRTTATYGIFVNTSISLIGESSQDTILTRDPVEYARYAESSVYIKADDVEISGFTISGSLEGILLYGSDCKIIGNNLSNNRVGISAEGKNNIISGNNITDNQSFGISLHSSDSIISDNNFTRNSEGVFVFDTENVTLTQNNIVGNGGGLRLRGAGPFYIYENNVTDNSIYGLHFVVCSYSVFHNNNFARNQIGVSLIPDVYESMVGEGEGNKFYYNNLVENEINVAVEQSGSAGIVSWDNGVVGNYWSDYSGEGAYVIDENNIDHYPLTQEIDISATPPTPQSESVTPSNFIEVTVIVIAVIMVVLVSAGLLVYFKKRKRGRL
jgi:parallel beta-helix repeat protein